MIPTMADHTPAEGIEAPRKKKNPHRLKGGAARVGKLRARQSGIHPVILELASFAMAPNRRRSRWPSDPDETLALLTQDSATVVAIMKKHHLPHDSKPPI